MAVSHTCLVHQGRVGMEEGEKMFYDENKQHILVARGNTLKAFDFSKAPADTSNTSTPIWEAQVEDVGSSLHIGVSADQNTIAVQRDEKRVEFVDRQTGNIFIEACRKPKKTILGFFFVHCQECSFVMVTSSGLELSKFSSDRKALKLRNKFKQTIRWYTYTFATRMVAIGTGKTGARVQGYQFTWAETVKLPQVDFDAAPFPVTAEDLLNASMVGPRQPPPLVTVEDVILLRLYNRIFIGHIDRSRMRLRLYRVFMDTIMLAREYELFSPLLAFNVVDNIILLHQRQASVAVLMDVASTSSEPIGSPLPLIAVQDPSSEDSGVESGREIKKFTSRWKFFLPNIVVDEAGNVYKTQLDLPSVIASSPGTYPTVGFLNRRRPGVHTLGNPRTLLIDELRSILKKGVSRQAVRRILCSLHKDGSEDIVGEKEDKTASVALTLQTSVLGSEDMCKEVFSVVLDGREADPGYMEGILMDYMEISGKKGVEVPAAAYIVMIDVLLLQDKTFQLQQLLAGSSHMQNLQIAEHLESHADESGSEFIRKLSLDVYARCGVRSRVQGNRAGCELYCNKLLKAGKVISALRVAHHHQITSLQASACLEAARKTGDPKIMRAVERFCNQSGRTYTV